MASNKKIVRIDDKYHIEVDELNWTLHCLKPTDQSKKTTKNNERDVVVGYYSNLRGVIERYIEDNGIKNLDEVNDLRGYCDFVEKNNKEAVEKVYKLLKE